MAETFDSSLVTLGYGGSIYYARNVRYWLRSRSDGFVYADSDKPDDLTFQANKHIGVWDREKKAWLND